MTTQEWEDDLDRYRAKYPFGDYLKVIKFKKADVDSQLLEECVQKYIVAETAYGYLITHENLEKHLEVINEHGMEAYLEKRLEVLDEQ